MYATISGDHRGNFLIRLRMDGSAVIRRQRSHVYLLPEKHWVQKLPTRETMYAVYRPEETGVNPACRHLFRSMRSAPALPGELVLVKQNIRTLFDWGDELESVGSMDRVSPLRTLEWRDLEELDKMIFGPGRIETITEDAE